VTSETSRDSVEREIAEFLETRTKVAVAVDQDLFATGLVSSMFAMELVVHLERAYEVAIVGADLRLVNFRTVASMTDLVLRLRTVTAVSDG
jgi:methoxymalonate biosynthesis acyl carrier protein